MRRGQNIDGAAIEIMRWRAAIAEDGLYVRLFQKRDKMLRYAACQYDAAKRAIGEGKVACLLYTSPSPRD